MLSTTPTVCDTVSLQAGTLSVGVVPQWGGALAWLRANGQDLLRPLPEQAAWQPTPERLSSSYPLVPYSNRIADGQFHWLGETKSLRQNFGDHPHSLHGFGWQRPWRIERKTEQTLELSLDHAADDDWPWRCQTRQTLSLTPQGLACTLSLHNRDTTPMPAGLGWHPYFQRTPEMRLQFRAEKVWLMDEAKLPKRPIRVPGRWNYQAERPVGWPELDHCFAGWSGQAHIVWPEYGLRLKLFSPDALNHLVVFTPNNRDFIALEPVTHVNNAVNLANPTAQGMTILRPNETMTRHLNFQVSAIATEPQDA